MPTAASSASTQDLYYRTDHHWTPRAGWLAAQVITDRLRSDGLTLNPVDPLSYTFTALPTHGQTLAKLIGLSEAGQDYLINIGRAWATDTVPRPDVIIPAPFPYPANYVINYQQREVAARDSLSSLFVTRESFGENIAHPLAEVSAAHSFFSTNGSTALTWAITNVRVATLTCN